MEELAELFDRAAAGSAVARDALFEALYPALRRQAHARLYEHSDVSQLQTTALVHEVYLRLVNNPSRAECRPQFMAYAATIMRSIITDLARGRLSQRRGEGAPHLPFDTEQEERVTDDDAREILRVHEAV